MNTFLEGDLRFQFPPHWGVRQYDQHMFYRGLSGLGLKGVDFLLIDPTDGGRLYFLEVKNYRTRTTEDGTFIATPKPPRRLAKTVARKYVDTGRAVAAIYGYYRRQWWYRALESWLLQRSNFRYDRVFWTRVQAMLEEGTAVSVVLWLEVETKDRAYVLDIRRALQEQLAAHVDVSVWTREGGILPGILVEPLDPSG